MSKIRKAVIPAAGLGTRFLPITKTFAKEMLPIIDKPNLQYIAEECYKSGIEELIIIISDDKPEIKDYFTRYIHLENLLKKAGKEDEAEKIKDIGSMIKITYVKQKNPLGLGNAILCAKNVVGKDDFALILGDDLVYNEEKPAIGQLIEAYKTTDSCILGVQEIDHSQVSKYGIVKIDGIKKGDCFLVEDIVEKPEINKAPSNFACLGRYILKNEIFLELEKVKPDKKGEYQLTDAIFALMKTENVYAYNFEGIRYDIGDKFGYIKAIIDFSLRRDDLQEEVKEYLKSLDLK